MRGTDSVLFSDARLLHVREDVSTWHVALENGSDVHVNERQKIRRYRGRSTGE